MDATVENKTDIASSSIYYSLNSQVIVHRCN